MAIQCWFLFTTYPTLIHDPPSLSTRRILIDLPLILAIRYSHGHYSMFRCERITTHYRKTRFNVCLAARSGYNSARWVPGFVSAQLLHRILVFTQPDRRPKVGFVVMKWNAAPIARLALQSSGLLSWAPARHRLWGNRGLEPLIFSLL